jgi:hypothetical protein
MPLCEYLTNMLAVPGAPTTQICSGKAQDAPIPPQSSGNRLILFRIEPINICV